MKRVLPWLTRGLGSVYFLALYALFTLLAPSKPAFGQDCNDFDVAAGDNSVNNSIDFELLGKKFTFARNIAASGVMSRECGSTVKRVAISASETKNITVFSKQTALLDWSTNGVGVLAFGSENFNGDFSLKLFPGGGAGVEQTIVAGAPYSLTLNLSAKKSVNVSPTFTVDHDFGTIEIPALKIRGVTIIPATKFKIGTIGVDFELDAAVNVTESANGSMTMLFQQTASNASGIDLTGKLDFSTTTKLERSVKLLKVGGFGFKAETKVTGEGKLDFGKSDYEVDAHPRYNDLKGKATSDIDKMDIEIGGKIKADITFTFVVEAHIGEVELVDLPKWTFKEVGSKKVLYER
jgi:hypothetical protein